MVPPDALSAAVAGVRVGRAEACRVSAAGPWGMRYTGLEVSGFHVLVRGTAWLVTPDEPPRQLAPGDVVLVQPGVEHGFSPAPARLASLPPAILGSGGGEDADVEFVCGAYWMDRGRFAKNLTPVPGVIVSAAEDTDAHLRGILALLAAELDATRPGAAIATRALLDLLLTQVLRRWFEENGDITLPEQRDPEIAYVIRALLAAPERPWTVRELADLVHLPSRRFSRRFAAVTGSPPMSYLTSWRLARAAQLLRESSQPLAAIAPAVGYASEFALSAAFRREFGLAPGRYRTNATLAPGASLMTGHG